MQTVGLTVGSLHVMVYRKEMGLFGVPTSTEFLRMIKYSKQETDG